MTSSLSFLSCYIATPQKIVSNVFRNISTISCIAAPLLMSVAIPVAKGGIVAATACFVACEAFLATLVPAAAVAYAPHCFAGCKIALAAPTP